MYETHAVVDYHLAMETTASSRLLLAKVMIFDEKCDEKDKTVYGVNVYVSFYCIFTPIEEKMLYLCTRVRMSNE